MRKLIIVLLLLFSFTFFADKVVVMKVVDGDTIKVLWNNELETCRLIGVDTPETVHPNKPIQYYGVEASNYTKEILFIGREIEITFDKNQRDFFQRLLVYVWLEGELFNLDLVKNGYGKAYLKFKFDKELMEQFKMAQNFAKENKLGLWGEE